MISIKAVSVPPRPDSDADHFLVTLFKDGEPVLETYYSTGPAHPFLWAQKGADGDRQAQRAWNSLIYKTPSPHRVPLHDEPLRNLIRDRYRALAPIKVENFMEAILQDAQGSDQLFEDWCWEYGFDPDSRKAYRIWETCNEIRRKLEKAFGDLEPLHREFCE